MFNHTLVRDAYFQPIMSIIGRQWRIQGLWGFGRQIHAKSKILIKIQKNLQSYINIQNMLERKNV